MADNQKDRFIQYLAEQHREDELTKKAMELVLEDFMARQKELDEKMSVLMSGHSSLKAELLEERRLRKAAERENRSLRERLGQANEERYGEKRQRVRKKNDSGEVEKPEPDRNDEKDEFDGMEGSLRTGSVDDGCPPSASAAPKQERDQSNRPDTYERTDITATYHSVISTVKLYGGFAWEFIGTFFRNIFNGCRDYANMLSDKTHYGHVLTLIFTANL